MWYVCTIPHSATKGIKNPTIRDKTEQNKKEQLPSADLSWELPESSSAKAVFPEKTLLPICIFPGRKCGPSSLLSLQSLVRISVGLDASLQALYPSLRSGGRTDEVRLAALWGNTLWDPQRRRNSSVTVCFPSHGLTHVYAWASGLLALSPFLLFLVKHLFIYMNSLRVRQGL